MERRNLHKIAGGYAHTLRIEDGIVWAWGQNDFGQLGIGNTMSVSTPFFVRNLTNIVSVCAGHDHSLALAADGKVWAWGSNQSKQLGTSSQDNQLLPSSVKFQDGSDLSKIKAIAAGAYHNLALTADSRVFSWGLNGSALGRGSTQSLPYFPALVYEANNKPLQNVVAVAAGLEHSLALKADGTVWAWGNNAQKQVGSSTQIEINFAQQVSAEGEQALDQVKSIAAGSWHSLALKADGSVWAWGSNDRGQLGNGSFQSSQFPVQVNFKPFSDSNALPIVGKFTAIAAGHQFSMGLFHSGSVVTWGANDVGQLGFQAQNFATEISSTSFPILGGRKQNIFVSKFSTEEERKSEQEIKTSFIRYIAAGYAHAAALGVDDKLWTWGYNKHGQLGYVVNTESVSKLSSGNNSIQPPLQVVKRFHSPIASGIDHSVAIKGTYVWSWGRNSLGQLGNGRPNRQPSPEATPEAQQVILDDGRPLSGIVALSAGDNYTLALRVDGTVWAWGENSSGQLGRKIDTFFPYAAQVTTESEFLSNITTIAAGGNSNFATKVDGKTWCWGDNSDSTLGVGNSYGVKTQIDYAVKQSPNNFENQHLQNIFFKFVSAGETHALALDSAGQIWSWGIGPDGGLGLGGGFIPSLSGRSRTPVPNRANIPQKIYYWNRLTTINSVLLKKDEGLELDNSKVDKFIRTHLEQLSNPYILSNSIDISSISNSGQNVDAADKVWIIYDIDNGWRFRIVKREVGGVSVNFHVTIFIAVPRTMISVSAGKSNSLALEINGDAWAWGIQPSDNSSRAEQGFTQNEVEPKKKHGIQNGVSVFSGNRSNFCITIDNNCWAWGINLGGLGVAGVFPPRPNVAAKGTLTPLLVSGSLDSVSPNKFNHTLFSDNKFVFASGNGNDGKLGPKSRNEFQQYVSSVGLVDALYVSGVLSIMGGGEHSLALRDCGEVWAWGNNFFNEIGNANIISSKIKDVVNPVKVDSALLDNEQRLPLNQIEELHASYAQSLAIRKDTNISNVWEWGLSRVQENAEEAIEAKRSKPFAMRSEYAKKIDNAISVSGWGWNNTFIINAQGEVFSAGFDNFGQLGNGKNSANVEFERINSLSNIISIKAAPFHVLALDVNGNIFAWGDNSFGQLGNSNINTSPVPIRVSLEQNRPFSNIIAIAAGQGISVALDAQGAIWLWGLIGQTRLTSPTKVKEIEDVTTIEHGRLHGIAINASGEVLTWGSNKYGQLGVGADNNFQDIPLKIKGSSTFKQGVYKISAGDYHSLMLKPNGEVGVWGKNTEGQLGIGLISRSLQIPKQAKIGTGKW